MRVIIAVGLVFAAAAPAWAQDQQLGARTKAMGGSYTAFEDDPVSIWLNPAGIATQPSALALSYQTYTTYPLNVESTGSTVETSAGGFSTFVDPAFIPSYLGVVFQVGTPESPAAIGVCYARPFHLSYSFDRLEDPLQAPSSPDTNVEESFSRFRIAFAKDFRLREAGAFTHLSVGLGLDAGYERWSFDSSTSASGNATAPGYGLGVLLGVYDNTENLKINFGLAYQSTIRWHFNIDPEIMPAFDMPNQLNVGLTAYLADKYPLRLTVDFQWVEWSETAEKPAFLGHPEFRNALNYSLGGEYRIRLSEKVAFFPRLGYRRFQAPWEDPDDLPMTSNFKLLLDTDAGEFNIVTLGFGLAITDEKGKSWLVDAGFDVGGDSSNLAVSFTFEL